MKETMKAPFKFSRWHFIGGLLFFAIILAFPRINQKFGDILSSAFILFVAIFFSVNAFLAYKNEKVSSASAGTFLNVLTYIIIAAAVIGFICFWKRMQRF
jgi:hypothetical protein